MSLALLLDPYVNAGMVDSVKFSRKSLVAGEEDCAMCVYCDDRDRDRVWGILQSVGVSRRTWKYDNQTIKDWAPGGRLRNLYG